MVTKIQNTFETAKCNQEKKLRCNYFLIFRQFLIFFMEHGDSLIKANEIKKKVQNLEVSETIRIFASVKVYMDQKDNNYRININSIMKKTNLTLFAAAALMLSSCLTTGMGTTSNTNSTSNVLGTVLGSVLSNVLFGGQTGILGTWSYNAPSAAFTTEKTLTNAGGNAAVTNMSSSLANSYNAIGINRSNTSFSFLSDNKFSAKVNGIPFSGTYAYNSQNGEISLKTSTETIKGNVIKTAKGMGLMFDSTQMTNILQKEGKVSNAAAVQAVSKLAKSANGARVGFELTK